MSECEANREHLLAAVRGRLDEPERTRFERHLETCAECRRLFERERGLDEALAKRPTYALPSSLRAQLTARVTPAVPVTPITKSKRNFTRLATMLAPSLVAAALLVFVASKWITPNQELVGEAVNDHLRVLYAERPIEIESGGIHQVKPWFTGRVDFAPPFSFSGDDEFPLQGGAISLFVDRKAATFIFKHKLHTITLFVFRNEGLSWPLRNDTSIGPLPGSASHLRGFNTLLWRKADLGYALVSDVDPAELQRLAAKIDAS